MKIVFITGTMGSGKSKYIFDFLDKETFKDADILTCKHSSQTRDGDFIKSLAYPERQLNCKKSEDLMSLDISNKKCIIIDEYQFFKPENLKESITFLNEKSDCELLIFAGLQFYANGEEWESYKSVINIAKELNIELEKVYPNGHRCDSTIRGNITRYHTLKEPLGESVWKSSS